MKPLDKREKLILVASRIFGRQGYVGAGIDQIVSESGIAKTTLYRHFKSKEELIVAVLQHTDEQFRREMSRKSRKAGCDPKERLLATFDFLGEWFASEGFNGCPFICAACEFSEPGNQVCQAVVSHKKLMVSYFETLADDAGFQNARDVAKEINLLHEGATAVAHATGQRSAANDAKAVARKLLTIERTRNIRT